MHEAVYIRGKLSIGEGRTHGRQPGRGLVGIGWTGNASALADSRRTGSLRSKRSSVAPPVMDGKDNESRLTPMVDR